MVEHRSRVAVGLVLGLIAPACDDPENIGIGVSGTCDGGCVTNRLGESVSCSCNDATGAAVILPIWTVELAPGDRQCLSLEQGVEAECSCGVPELRTWEWPAECGAAGSYGVFW